MIGVVSRWFEFELFELLFVLLLLILLLLTLVGGAYGDLDRSLVPLMLLLVTDVVVGVDDINEYGYINPLLMPFFLSSSIVACVGCCCCCCGGCCCC